MKDHWIEIRHGAQRCCAQIEDCRPYRSDDANYVFKNECTLPHPNNAPHSMSVLQFDNFLDSGLDVCSWRFCEDREVPPGAWTYFSPNNSVAVLNTKLK
jgi:hypothetical protein